MKSTTFSCSSVATSQFAAAFAVFISVAVYVSHAASCSNSLMTSLQIDPSTQLITLATATSTRQAPSVLQPATSSSAFLNIRDESTDVSAFLCYDPTNVNKTVANYLCTSTFGDGFTASLVTPVAIATSLTSNNTDVATRFPFLVSNATASTTTTAVLSNLLLKLRALSCISHVFNDPSTAIDSAAFSGACSLCSVEALSTCPSLAQITCSAPADIDRANPYAPLVVSSPSQWANATIAFDSQFTAPPAWVPQALCNADISSSDKVVTAVLGAGHGVVGNDAAGYASGFDALQFAPMQFSLSCSTTSASTATSGNDVVAQGCTMTPTVNSSATAVVSAVNMSRAMIVGCSVANRGTPPLLQPSLSRATPSDSCQFVMTPSTSVDVDVTSLAQLSSLQAEASAMLLASSSTVDMYLAAWCPTLPPSSTESSTSASLHRYRVCTTDALWRSMIIHLCRAAGFDGGELQPLLSASQISVADIASNSSGNLSSMLLRLRCPSSYFPTQQINEDFDNCDMTWVPRSSISAVVTATPGTTTSTISASPCTARYLRCYMVAEQQQERVEWIFGSTLFCIVFVGSMVISTFSLWSERRQLLNANSATLHRRRSTRLRTRSSKPSDTTSVAMLGLSSADVTNLVLGDTQRNVSLQKKRSSSVMSTEERPLTMTTSSVGKGSGGSSDGGSTYGNSIRDSDVLLLPAAGSSPPLLPPQQSPRFAIPRGGEVEL